jgi:hypothetical protein
MRGRGELLRVSEYLLVMSAAAMMMPAASLAAGQKSANARASERATFAAKQRSGRILRLRDTFLRANVVRPYLRHKTQQQKEPAPKQVLPPPVGLTASSAAYRFGGECVEVLCEHLGELGCNTEDQVLGIVRACAGNYSGDCVRSACRQLGPLGCDTAEQAESMAEVCAFNVSGDCLNAGCGLVGHLDCDAAGVTTILDACAGNFGDACVRDVCKRLGQLGCKTLDEFAEVARSCGVY